MNNWFQQAMKIILCLIPLILCDLASGQSTTTGKTLVGGGTLSYTIVNKGRQPCNPNKPTQLPEFVQWTFDQFVYTDATGASYPLSGAALFIEDIGGNSGCPGTAGIPVVLNGPAFIINVQPGPGTLTATFHVAVLTHHYDNLRTGQNIHETSLAPSNVNTSQFGRLFSRTVDGNIAGQPLYMSSLNIAGGTHNVVFVTTESDSVYAFDADSNSGANANPLWHASLIDTAHGATSGETPAFDSSQTPPDIGGGITSTPVIDPATNAMYVEAKSQLVANGVTTYFHRLHVLDLFTGNETSPGPKLITGSVPGIGGGGTTVNFNDVIKNQRNRPGLLLVNGTIYVGFASDHQDFAFGQYYGWVFAYDEATLAQKGVFNTTPNGVFNPPLSAAGGVWMSGAGLATDSSGNVFFATGNGLFDTESDFGDSILKVALSNGNLTLVDSFTPYDQLFLNQNDVDLGSGGVLLLPDQSSTPQHLLVQAGKDGSIHLLDRDQLTINNQHYCSGCSSDTNTHQEIPGAVGGMWAMPTYWNGRVYFWGLGDTLKAYTLSNSLLSASPSFKSTDVYPFAANTSISANGATDGILWAAEADSNPAMILNAYNASNGQKLYSSATNQSRDNAGGSVHFIVPVVANGKVYLGGTQLSVYGLNPP